jgi:hypothetical protein
MPLRIVQVFLRAFAACNSVLLTRIGPLYTNSRSSDITPMFHKTTPEGRGEARGATLTWQARHRPSL